LAAAVEAGDAQTLSLVAEYGPVEVWALLRRSGDSPLARRAQGVRLADLERAADRWDLRFVIPGDPEWPDSLGDLGRHDGFAGLGGLPVGLWLAGPGRLDDVSRHAVAIVGSRAATAYGEHVSADLAAGLAEHGCSVASGGAYGIDAAAHRGALAGGGRTLAVMAGGLSRLYPPGNASLLEQIREKHVIVSEHPPTRPPSRPRFLARNRLIAALSVATLVVEGGLRSGASNTVRWAQSLGRLVLAVPGPVTSALSFTPHRLIRDGEAVLAATVEDVVSAIGGLEPAAEERQRAPAAPYDKLDAVERVVFEELPGRGETTADALSERTGLAVSAVLASLSRLSETGLAVSTGRGTWRLG
jgi:DNA processing protein